MKTEHPGPPPGPGLFSEELRRLIDEFDDRPVQLGTLLAAARGRGYYFLLLVIALPFVGPVPLPGFSVPFGAVVALIGTRLAFDRKPWLPQCLLRREIPAHTLAKWLGGAGRIMRGIEHLLRPRLSFVSNHLAFGRLAGLQIAVSGLMLTLPLPLPFSNSLPAWTVLLLAAGALGRDGVFYLAGCGMFAVSLVFFGALAWGGSGLIDRLLHLLGI
jgi:hypothetical protein